jgi:hypothetical protein
MSQSVKEFVRQSGVDVQSSDSNSNNNFAQELEADMFRRQRDQDREARMRAAGFREPLRPELIQRPQRPLPGPRALPPPDGVVSLTTLLWKMNLRTLIWTN